jgi:hypothetical protein
MDYKLPDFKHLQGVSFLLHITKDDARDKKIKNTEALSLFYLPNLQHLSASIENPPTFSWPTVQSPTPSKLISLDLTKVREEYLGESPSVTPNLKGLRWRWCYDFDIHDDLNTPIVDLDRMATAISHVGGTLTELTIIGDCEIGATDYYAPPIKIEGSLNAMVNWGMLKKLQIPWTFLVGFAEDRSKRLQDLISKNIEFLSITDDLKLQNDDGMVSDWPIWDWEDRAMLGLLQSWLEDWKACTPHLRRITLIICPEWIFHEFDEWTPDMRQEFRELCARTGVEIEIIELDHQVR